MNQFQIEKYVGITPEIAEYMMKSGTKKAENTMGLLRLAVNLPDVCALTLLKEAVKECEEDLK